MSGSAASPEGDAEHRTDRPATVPFRLPDMGAARAAKHRLTRNAALTAGVGAVAGGVVSLMTTGTIQTGSGGDASLWRVLPYLLLGLALAGLGTVWLTPRWKRHIDWLSRSRNNNTVRYLAWAHVLGLLMAGSTAVLLAAVVIYSSSLKQLSAQFQNSPMVIITLGSMGIAFLLGCALWLRTRWWGVRRAKAQRFVRRRFGRDRARWFMLGRR